MENGLDLAGEWVLSGEDGTSIPAALPGDNYSALLAAGRIPDPYWGRNEILVQDIARKAWCFSRTFSLEPDFLASPYICLNLERVDTFAEIRINGKKILRTKNMFRRYRTEIKRFLKAGKNTIEINIASAWKEADRIAAAESLKLSGMQGMAKTINRIRKTQCHGGWDWGICLMVSGVYGELTLTGHNVAKLEHLYDRQIFDDKGCTVELTAELHAFAAGTLPVVFAFNGEIKTIRARLKEGENRVRTVFLVPHPRLWYPAGMGEAVLYDALVSSPDGSLAHRIGLRKLEVINEEDAAGRSLGFRVNGTDLFAKGANWIPTDALPARQTRETTEWLLDSALRANMNIIRVWGGGQYESDFFYEMCDEKGLLVWQDMMFACGTYPSTPEFTENVREEIEFQIRRLRHHPCIALWCGDNECIGALQWDAVARAASKTYLINYDRLNRELGKAVEQCDPERVFWPSSPCGGPGNFNDNWHDDRCGDMHYWEVWHGSKPFSAYYNVRPRFCSEFGYQSFPSFETVRTYADENNYNVFSPQVDYHEKCYHGCAPIIGMFGRYFRMPSRFEDFLYLSQVQQMLAIKTGVEYWRSLRPHCLGAIIWQLNDNWPVASWSSIEYGGKWKLLHYGIRNFFAPLAVIAYRAPGEALRAFVLNDLPKALTLQIRLRWFDFSGALVAASTRNCRVGAGAVAELGNMQIPAVAEESVFLVLELYQDEEKVAENTVFLAPYKLCELAETEIQTHFAFADGACDVQLTSSAPAFFCALDAEGIPGVFSDNAFTLLPNEPRRIRFTPRGEITLAAFRDAFKIRHLRQTY